MQISDASRKRDISRRLFLRGSTLATAGMSLVEIASALGSEAGESGPAVVGPGSISISLKVNGVIRTLQGEPRMTLAEALRDQLGLTGTKVACDRGACSACTVWLDGMPVLACMSLAINVGEQDVTTIEALAAGGELHPVQTAFIEHDALQCGFCTPGMVMSCAALLKRTPDPTADDVEKAISGHLCRCGTYPHVVEATLAAAKARRA
jgi:aerobic-type carbon monoxide dehydrogenase small subunit (CoxS/CutS family)